MPDVLTQAEVDALLQAVGGDEAPKAAESAKDAAPAERKARPEPVPEGFTVYDFKRPNRVSGDQMRAISSLHEQFARNLAADLTGMLRTLITIQSSQAEQLTFQEFTMSLPNPTGITILSVEPLSGEMILEFNPTICFPIIDRLLGGGHVNSAFPERPFTEIESRLLGQIMEHIINHLQEVWNPVADMHFAIQDTETNPQILQNVAPNEIVVLLTFEVRMSEGDAGGMLNFCIPFNVIEPIMDKLSSRNWFLDRSKADPQDEVRVKANIQDVPLPIEAFVAETVLNIHDISTLKPGDIIQTPKVHNRPLLLSIAGKPKFRTVMGQIRGHKAVKIESTARESDGLNI